MAEPDQSVIVPLLPISYLVSRPISPYADDLAHAGLLADAAVQADTFVDYHANCAENTSATQCNTPNKYRLVLYKRNDQIRAH